MATIAQLIADSEQIRDETIPGANSANRVGTLFKNISETFGEVNGNINSYVFIYNNITIPANGAGDVITIDTSFKGASNKGFTYDFNFYAYLAMPLGDGSGAYTMFTRRDGWTGRMNREGTTQDTTTYSNPSIAAHADVPSFRTIVDFQFAPYLKSTGVLAIERDYGSTGSSMQPIVLNARVEIVIVTDNAQPIVTNLGF